MRTSFGKVLAMSAWGGILAGLTGCASAPAPAPNVPGAPSADPEGSVPAAAAKHSCGGKGGCGAAKGGCGADKGGCGADKGGCGADKGGCGAKAASPDEAKKPAAPTTAPAAPSAAPATEKKNGCGSKNGCSASMQGGAPDAPKQ